MADERPRPRWDIDVAAFGILLLLLVFLFFEAVFRGEVFFERDLHLDWYTRTECFVRSVTSGSWPLWDNCLGFGQPLLADPSAQVLYPPTWLNLILQPWTYYTLYVVAHLTFSGFGLYRLARALGISPACSIGAGAAWVLSGPLLSLVNLWHHFAGAAWLPWVLVALSSLIEAPAVGRALLLGVTLAGQILAGSADMCALTYLAAAAFALPRLGGRRFLRPWPGRVLALAGLSAAVALALSAGLWVPALELVRRSARWRLGADVQTAWSLPLPGLARLVLPLLISDFPLEPGWRQALFDHDLPFLDSVYLGLPALGLAALAFASRDRGGRAWMGALALAALLVSLGRHAPFYSLALAVIPPLRILRYPSKALLLVAFALALLAGMGLEVLRRRERLDRRLLWLVLGPVCLVALGAGTAAILLLASPNRFGPLFLGLVPGLPATDLLLSLGRALLVSSVGTAIIVLVILRHAGSGAGGARAALAGLLLAGDLFFAHRPLNSTAPRELLTSVPPAAAAVRNPDRARLYVYDYHTFLAKSRQYLGRDDPYPIGALPPGWVRARAEALAVRLYLFPPLAGWYGIEGSYDLDTRGLYPTALSELTLFLRAAEGTPTHLRLLRAGAVRWVLSLHERGLTDLVPVATLTSLFPEPIRLFRVPDSLPRAYAVGGARVASGAAALRCFADPTFDPAREVIVAEGRTSSPPSSFLGESRILEFRPDRVRLEATLTDPGYLVLVDAYDPGWRATVDGAPTPVLPANVAFRAVPVPPGRHTIDMVYRPRAVTVGLLVSATALVAVGAVSLARRRPKGG